MRAQTTRAIADAPATIRPPSAGPSSRHSSERARKARAAEQAVARFLTTHGFSIVATNLRLSYLELDVVARRGELVVVVEVRSRGSSAWTSPFGSIDGKKRYRIRLAGQRLWQRRYLHDLSVNRLRFDAASVVFGPDGVPEIEYVEAAF